MIVLNSDTVIDVTDAGIVSTERLSTLYAALSSSFQASVYSTFLRRFVEFEWIIAVRAFPFLIHTARLLGQADQIRRDIVLVLALVAAAIPRIFGTV